MEDNRFASLNTRVTEDGVKNQKIINKSNDLQTKSEYDNQDTKKNNMNFNLQDNNDLISILEEIYQKNNNEINEYIKNLNEQKDLIKYRDDMIRYNFPMKFTYVALGSALGIEDED